LAGGTVGDHDLNSFRLRFEPLADADDLQPGTTVWLAGR
jgi:HlyD family secretion protein